MPPVTSTLKRPAQADHFVEWLVPFATTNPQRTHAHRSPLDGELITQLPLSDAHSVEQAFAKARAAQPGWAARSVSERTHIIARFHDLVLDRQAEILDLIQWENGKSRGNAMDEVLDVCLTSRYYVATSAKLLRPKRRRGAFPVVTKTLEVRHPHGVVGFISPWNYPFTLAISDFLPALIAGNTVVLRPDLQTTLTALWGAALLHKAGLPEGVLNVVVGEGADLGPLIVEQADYVMFTGSTRVGRIVATQAATRLIGSSMELGGKNSLIIAPDADLATAVEVAARGAFANSGQLCIGTERIVVHSSMYDRFVDAFATAVAALKVSSSIGWGSDVGTLTHARQLETTERHIADAVAKGARVLVGGHRLPEVGPQAFAPTVLLDVTEAAEVCGTETFGPVCSVYRYETDDELVAFVNNTDYGLSAGIVSRNIAWAQSIARRLKVGTVNINEAFGSAYASIDAPMGGMGQSGVGRRHGSDGLLKYTEPQTIAQQRWMKLTPQWGMNDESWASFTSRAMRLLKSLGLK